MRPARRTRHFARSARRGEDKTERLLPVYCFGSSHVYYMNVAFQLVNWWPVVLARFWHVCLEQKGRHAVMLFWRWCSRSSRLFPEKKGKTKEMFKFRKDVLGLYQLGFEKGWFTNFFKLSVVRPNTTHKLVIMWNVTLEFVVATGFPSFLSRRCVWT